MPCCRLFAVQLASFCCRAQEKRQIRKSHSVVAPLHGPFLFYLRTCFVFHCGAQESDDDDSESDGLGADLDEDGDVELRLARLEHLLERRPILVRC